MHMASFIPVLGSAVKPISILGVISRLNQICLCPILTPIVSILVAASLGDVNHAVTFA